MVSYDLIVHRCSSRSVFVEHARRENNSPGVANFNPRMDVTVLLPNRTILKWISLTHRWEPSNTPFRRVQVRGKPGILASWVPGAHGANFP